MTALSHRAIGWAAALGTVPYLTIKTIWLTGGSVGVTDRAFLADPAVVALNGVTAALDLVVVGLALALTHGWGRRLPAWLVLLPMWVGTGFLVPMLVILPAVLLGPPAPVFEPWLQPVVYGGFAWQAVFLCAAFAVYARARWSVSVPAGYAPAVAAVLHVVTAGGVGMAVLSAGLLVAGGVTAGGVAAIGMAAVNAALALGGAAGVVALVRGVSGRRWIAAAAAWTGSAAMFSWGLYGAVITMAATPLAGGSAIGGMAQLTGLLGGFALAVAGLLALTDTAAAPALPTPRTTVGVS